MNCHCQLLLHWHRDTQLKVVCPKNMPLLGLQDVTRGGLIHRGRASRHVLRPSLTMACCKGVASKSIFFLTSDWTRSIAAEARGMMLVIAVIITVTATSDSYSAYRLRRTTTSTWNHYYYLPPTGPCACGQPWPPLAAAELPHARRQRRCKLPAGRLLGIPICSPLEGW